MLPKTKDQRRFNEYAPCGTSLLLQHRRKRNKKYKLLQSYLPLLGWGFLSLLAIILAFREHRFSGARHTLREAHKDMQSLQNQQVQMQVILSTKETINHFVCSDAYVQKVSVTLRNVLSCDIQKAQNKLAGHSSNRDRFPFAMCTMQWKTDQHTHGKSVLVLAVLYCLGNRALSCRQQVCKRIKASGSSTPKSIKQKET